MPGHTFQLALREDGWHVATLDDRTQPERDFPSLDDALEWCARQRPQAIRMPDHVFAPTGQGPGMDVSSDHSPYQP
jgi:hypothetical protein